VPVELLRCLYSLNKESLFCLTARNLEDAIIGFDIIYLHGSSATYIVGWENDEGRKNNTNNLLLFNVLIYLKRKNYLFFDTGGLDFVKTEDIVHFKRGISGKEYELIGEFIHL
jgi:lipid II:glycine glycyltransferase (peptidoglycan interpeptide bridge formation enzyme)